MFTALLIAVAPAPVPPPELPPVLSHALVFGVTPAEARANYDRAGNHPWTRRDEVWAWNLPAVAEHWEAECRWRRECWDRLDDVINCPNLDLRRRVWALYRLRELIGPDAFDAGRMPGPTPAYVTHP